MSIGAIALVALVAWALLAFAGRDRWAVAILGAGAVVAAAVCRPRFRYSHRLVDAAVLACLAFGAAQLIPLPPALRLTLSPGSAAVDRAILMAPPADPMAGPWHPLTIDADASRWAMGLAGAALLIFWSARATFERGGGLRFTVRAIAWLGLFVTVVTFVQRATSPHLFYGIWAPVARTDTPTPFGPFLNRNDLATWLLLALPLVAGYIVARVGSRGRGGISVAGVEEIFDSRMVVLLGALCLMMALLLSTGSRSGMVGCSVGFASLLWLGRRRASAAQFVALLAGLALVALVATAYVSVPMLAARFGDALAPDYGRGRLAIWRQTWPMARDFLRTGIGVGAFERGMIVYEARPFTLFINQAHDEYLQVLAEGGVPLAALASLTTLAGWREARRRMLDDPTSVGWVRAGAVSGVIAVAVQSIWDTGLRVPANAVLFAVVAAIALHSGAIGTRTHSKGASA